MAKTQDRLKLSNDEVADEVAKQSGMPKTKKKVGTAYESVYALKGDSKIPISKHEGKIWEARKDSAIKLLSKTRCAWEEALKYYNNDQMSHRTQSDGSYSGNDINSRLGRGHSETENIVFSDTKTMVSVIYAKNPTVEITSESESFDKERQEVLADLINVLIAKSSAPGIGLKYKAKRAVAIAELTNNAWLKLSWTPKDENSETALMEFENISKQMIDAKNPREIEKLEGKLVALEERIAMFSPKGAGAKVLSPFNVIVDPTCKEPDLSDALWLIELDYLATDFLNCEYGEKDEDGKLKMKYAPTHYMKLGGDSGVDDVQSIVNNFSILTGKEQDYEALGFKSEEAYRKSCYTEVAWVWDKLKRQLKLYSTSDWTWPLWVWDDPLKLDRFFPYYRISFYLNPLGGQTKGEVTYYLDQQDAINEINDEERRSRDWIKRNVLFNKRKIKQEDVESYLKGNDGTARGVDLVEGEKFTDAVWSQPPPSFAFQDMFLQQKQMKLDAIRRINSMTDVLAGTQFKTNTTNQAIDSYQKSTAIGVDDRVDVLEDVLGDFLWGLAQLCLMNYSPEEVGELLNKDVSGKWEQITDPIELRRISLRVIGGSTKKPTSAAKKEEAIQVAQSLGQFANAAPMIVLKMLEVLENAFDELVITDQDWEDIKQSIIQAQMTSVGGAPGQPGEGSAADPNIDEAVRNAEARGVPPDVAREEIMKRVQG